MSRAQQNFHADHMWAACLRPLI